MQYAHELPNLISHERNRTVCIHFLQPAELTKLAKADQRFTEFYIMIMLTAIEKAMRAGYTHYLAIAAQGISLRILKTLIGHRKYGITVDCLVLSRKQYNEFTRDDKIWLEKADRVICMRLANSVTVRKIADKLMADAAGLLIVYHNQALGRFQSSDHLYQLARRRKIEICNLYEVMTQPGFDSMDIWSTMEFKEIGETL